LRVLTFNSHQPYLHLLATSLPWDFGVITPKMPSGVVRSWSEKIRPLPDNVRLYRSVESALADPPWDWILTHNVQDFLDVRDILLPKVFLVHGTLSGRILQDRAAIDRSEYIRNFETLLRTSGCRVVYISDLKRDDWGIPGRVVRTAVNASLYGGYHGESRGILQVCNHLRERGEMLGWETHEVVCRGLPHLLLGNNRGLPGARATESWEDLKEQYRTYRLYLHTAVHPYEDGYNLSVLEAMATGMPIATVFHPTSPIKDGVEGVVAPTARELRERVLWLLDHPREALQLGRSARQTLERDFPLAAFQSGWQTVGESMF
jgi:hypothetical protein